MTRRQISTYESLIDCRDYVLAALQDTDLRHLPFDKWSHAELLAVAIAANDWGRARGVGHRVTVTQVEDVERRAVGHSDYGPKLALYVAELVLGLDEQRTTKG